MLVHSGPEWPWWTWSSNLRISRYCQESTWLPQATFKYVWKIFQPLLTCGSWASKEMRECPQLPCEKRNVGKSSVDGGVQWAQLPLLCDITTRDLTPFIQMAVFNSRSQQLQIKISTPFSQFRFYNLFFKCHQVTLELSVQSPCFHPVFGPHFTPYPPFNWYW